MRKRTTVAAAVVLALLAASRADASSRARIPAGVPLEEEPARRRSVEATYPEAARRLGVEARVRFRCVIDRAGQVVTAHRGSVTTVPRATYEIEKTLQEAAHEAIFQRAYEPVPLSGPPFREFDAVVAFRLPDKPVHRASIEQLIRDVGGDDEVRRQEAWAELVDRGGEAVPALMRLFQQGQGSAVRMLAEMGAAGRSAGPGLERALAAGTPGAAYALIRVDPERAAVVLERAVRSGDDHACRLLATAWTNPRWTPHRKDAQLARASLLAALQRPGCRAEAVRVLPSVGSATEALTLEALITDGVPEVRESAVRLVAAFVSEQGSAEPPVEAILWRALEDPEPDVRSAASLALPALGARILPAAERLLRDPAVNVASQTARTLTALRLQARATGPALLAARETAKNPHLLRVLDTAIAAVGAGKTDAQLGVEDGIMALVVVEECRHRPGTVYLTIRGADVTPAQVAALGVEPGRVRPGSEARPHPSDGLQDGVILKIGGVRWVAGDLVEVGFSMWCGPLCAEWGHYVLVNRPAGWSILKRRIGAVS